MSLHIHGEIFRRRSHDLEGIVRGELVISEELRVSLQTVEEIEAVMGGR